MFNILHLPTCPGVRVGARGRCVLPGRAVGETGVLGAVPQPGLAAPAAHVGDGDRVTLPPEGRAADADAVGVAHLLADHPGARVREVVGAHQAVAVVAGSHLDGAVRYVGAQTN